MQFSRLLSYIQYNNVYNSYNSILENSIRYYHIAYCLKKIPQKKKAKRRLKPLACLRPSTTRIFTKPAYGSLARIQTTVVAVHASIRQRIFKGRTYGFAKLIRVTFHHLVVLFTVEFCPVRKYIAFTHNIYKQTLFTISQCITLRSISAPARCSTKLPTRQYYSEKKM